MKILIEKSGSTYRANIQDLPGSPPIGTASTPEEAIADLFWRVLHPDNREDWVQYIDFSKLKVETK